MASVVMNINAASMKGIELMEQNLGAIAKELEGWYRTLPNELVDAANDLLAEKIRQDALNGRDVNGGFHAPLSDKYASFKQAYVGTREADLHFGYREIPGAVVKKPRAFDNFYVERVGRTNRSLAYFDGDFGYMTAHQEGAPLRGLPQRKFFPDTDNEIMSNPNYADYVYDVWEMLVQYLDLLSRGEQKSFKRPANFPNKGRRG